MVDHLTAKQLREERAALAVKADEMRKLADTESRVFTAEEDAVFEAIHTDYESLKKRELVAARLETFDADMREIGEQRQQTPGRQDTGTSPPPTPGRPQITEKTRSDAFRGWALHQTGRKTLITDGIRAAADTLGVEFTDEDWHANLTHNYRQVRADYYRATYIRAQSVGTDTAGGFTVPEGFVPSLERALLQFGGMRTVSRVLRTATGNDLPWPTSNDTSNKGAILGENAAVSEQDVTFGQTIFYAFKYYTKLVRVSSELLTDSAFDMASELGSMLGERLARIQNEHFTTGDGAGKPEGITVGGTSGVTAAAAGDFTADELYDLKHSVDPAYREGATWMMNDTSLLELKKKKDGDGRYLWQSSLAGGTPDMIDGDPLQINQDMPSSTTGLKPIAYGDFSKYIIRDVAGVRTRRLVERYAEYDQEAFVGFMRADGKIIDAGTHPIKFMTMA